MLGLVAAHLLSIYTPFPLHFETEDEGEETENQQPEQEMQEEEPAAAQEESKPSSEEPHVPCARCGKWSHVTEWCWQPKPDHVPFNPNDDGSLREDLSCDCTSACDDPAF